MFKMNNKIILILVLVFVLVNVSAIRNPSAVYCEEMGYDFIINKTELGEQGICILSDGTKVNAWEFLRGEIAQEFSFCKKNGFEMKIIEYNEKCSSISSSKCAVCVKEDGEETEVTTKKLNSSK